MIVYFDRLFRKSVPREQKKNCENKLRQLSAAIEEDREKEFLNQNNAKPMEGAPCIWKFRATDAYRILYVHTKDIPWMRGKYEGIVLLRYTNHDMQGVTAANLDLNAVKTDGQLTYHSDFCFTESTTDTQAQRYFSEMSLFKINPLQISDFIETSNAQYDVVLNTEQAEILSESHFPLILYGCAGSGKTVLCAHLLYRQIQCYGDPRGLYTTLSKALPVNVKELVKNISITENGEDTVTDKIRFSPVSDFMLEKLGIKQSVFVDYDTFCYIFCETAGIISSKVEKLKQDFDIGRFDLWAEIRGIIKGHPDENWQWHDPISYNRLNDAGILWLKKNGFIKPWFDSDKFYLKTEKYANQPIFNIVSSVLDETGKKRDSILSAAQEIDEYSSEFDADKKSIDLKEYLALDRQYTIYDREAREKIYEVYELYQDWMDKNHYFDDNDLSRMLASKGEKCFDFIAVDEVQDLTEMQIYALTCCCRNPQAMVFAGDIHQVVNPTYYSEKRIRKLYYSRYGISDVSSSCLKKNYRSQDKIIKLANELSAIRKKRIGSYSKGSELPEQSSMSGWKPMRLEPSEENLINTVRTVNELSYAAIIVPDDNAADYISGLLDSESNGNIYTVAQIKGLEKRYIFCYNIASKYSDAWECIFSQDDIKKNSKFRYYFNALYVSVTRAQESLCFYEDSLPSKMDEWINKFAEPVETFDRHRLFLLEDENAGEGWYQSAKQCEENGDLDRAVVQYRRSQHDDYMHCIDRCNIRKMLKQNSAREALDFAFNRKNFELLGIIADDKRNQEIASLAERIVSFNNQDGKTDSTYQLFKDVSKYDTEGLILPLLTEKLMSVAVDYITDLGDYLKENQKGN